jgi:hypothetical protein
MTFDEWKDTDEYRGLTEIFGNFGYVEAIAQTAFNAAIANRATAKPVKIINQLHESHKSVRSSDASTFDFICDDCGATDSITGGWGGLRKPCKVGD